MDAGGLVKRIEVYSKSRGAKTYGLIEAGFKVVRERDQTRTRVRTNQALVAFTLVLGLAGVAGDFPIQQLDFGRISPYS